jgi:hypothetical protein
MAPLTECRPVPGPLVYGYLRLSACSRARRLALTRALATYCGQHELLLGGVFTDEPHSNPALSPGFAGLLDALSLEGSYGVVTPSVSHLGSGVTGRARLVRITETGRRLMLVRGAVVQAVPQ